MARKKQAPEQEAEPIREKVEVSVHIEKVDLTLGDFLGVFGRALKEGATLETKVRVSAFRLSGTGCQDLTISFTKEAPRG